MLIVSTFPLNAQSGTGESSTKDLSFLVGNWDISRIYNPGSSEERTYKGSLDCDFALDGKFIQCTYDMERPGKIRGINLVLFNYNSIYRYYESVWFSSTWPIKAIMRIDIEENPEAYSVKTAGQFKIENNVMEYVKGTLIAPIIAGKASTFTRQTYIRTSEHEAGKWHHHMTEEAKKNR